MTEIRHKHHIVPKHIGGKNGPVVKLTITEHAEEHRKLYEKYGRWQDRIAWLALSGQISNAEATKQAQSAANLGKRRSEEARRNISEGHKGQTPWNKGKKKSIPVNVTSFKKGNIPWNKGKTGVYSEELKRQWSLAHKRSRKI